MQAKQKQNNKHPPTSVTLEGAVYSKYTYKLLVTSLYSMQKALRLS